MNATPLARLLIVDDQPAQLQALSELLGDHGFEVHTLADPREAVKVLLEDHHELLLTDLVMPGMTGIELVRSALLIDPHLSAIVMTGEGSISTAVAAMKGGATDFILKPFKLGAVLPVLQRALEVRRLRVENAELARQLREHEAELVAANRELDAFTRSASHDLRTPLNAVLGYSTLLLHKLGPQLAPEHRRLVVNTELAARRMDCLISALMRLSHLGRQALQMEQVEVQGLVHEVVADLRQDQPGRAVTVRVEPLPPVLGDASLLRQVWFNLMSNAFKFTRRSDRPEIVADSREEDGQRVYTVRDNGSGFDMERANRLFEPFERLHHDAEFEGSGVGLSIVHRVIQRHGGRIWAESRPGHGAAFHFTLAPSDQGMPSA